MEAVVDIPEGDMKLLDELSTAEGLSREEWLQRAIATSLAPHRASALKAAFGLWRDCPEDGLAYQERMRNEWPERS